MCLRRGSERLPHVHHGQANARTLLLAKPAIEFRHARLRAILAAKPDRPTPQQIADHDPISVPLADCDLINADGERTRRARALKLRLHVLHLQRLDSVPVELQLLGNVRDRRLPATASDKIRKALGVQRIICQKVELLSLHLAAAATIHAPHLQLKQYSPLAARQITHLPDFTVVPTHLDVATTPASRFFERRFRVTMRTFGSPKTPRTTGSARNPSNEYVSQIRLKRFDLLAI